MSITQRIDLTPNSEAPPWGNHGNATLQWKPENTRTKRDIAAHALHASLAREVAPESKASVGCLKLRDTTKDADARQKVLPALP